MPEDLSEQELIDGLRKKENEKFAYLEDACFPFVLKWVRENSGDRADAEDVYQEGILKLYKKLKDPELKLDSMVSTYLIGICKKMWYNELKKRKRRTITADPQVSYTIDSYIKELMDKPVYRSILAVCFAKLQEDCRKILDLYYRDVRLADIAARLALSYSFVKKRKTHCNKVLIAFVYNHPDYSRL